MSTRFARAVLHLPAVLPAALLPAAVFLAALLFAGAASGRVRTVTEPGAPRSLPEHGAVSVRWADPAGFSEIRYSNNAAEARRGNWVEALARYLRERAERRLLPGERLDVEITDLERAGDYEPWQDPQLQDVRFLRDYYPPRMRLRFRHLGADGQVLAEGERRLVEPGYLAHGGALGNSQDPLRHEKHMIDRWLQRELPTPRR